jgi:CD81 antigen
MKNKCCSLVKLLAVLMNFLFWIVGVLMMILAIWMLVDPTFLMSLTQEENHYYYGLYILLAVGALLVVVSFLGCCGAFKESQCMLVSFFCCLLVVLTAEVAAGVWAFHNNTKLESLARATIKHTVSNEYGIIPSRTVAFDAFQKAFECCGAQGPSDWATSRYNNVDRPNVLDIGFSKMNPTYKVPESCCKDDIGREVCNISRSLGSSAALNPNIYHSGCMKRLLEELENNIQIVLLVAAGIVGLQLLGLIFALFLCCGIRRNDNYKA